MDVAEPCEFKGFGAMDATKPYESIGFGAMDATKPYEFIGFGAMDATKPYEFIGFGARCIRVPGIVALPLPPLRSARERSRGRSGQALIGP